MTKKAFIIMLALLTMTVAIFSGCTVKEVSETSEASTEEEKETVLETKEITMMFPEFALKDYGNPDLELYKKLNEVAQVKIKPMFYPESGYKEKVSIVIAGGDMPDTMILLGVSTFDIKSYGVKGVFLPISDHLSKMPNYNKYLEKYKDQKHLITATNGKIYTINQIYDYPQMPKFAGVVIRGDILEKNNFDPKSIQTFDDLYNALKVIKEATGLPPYAGRSGVKNIEYFANMFGTSIYAPYYDNSLKKFTNPYVTQNLKDCVEYLYKLNKDGLLGDDWLTMNSSDWKTAIRSGKRFAYVDEVYTTELNEAKFTEDLVNAGARLEIVIPPKYNGKRASFPVLPNIFENDSAVVNPKTKAADNILKMWDWLYSQEGYEFVNFGVEGVTYKVLPDGSKICLFGIPEKSEELGKKWGIGYDATFGRLVTRESEMFRLRESEEPQVYRYEEYEKEMKENVDMFVMPTLNFTDEEMESYKLISTPLNTYVEENIPQFILGNKPMTEWDNFVKETEKFKVNELIDLYNTVLNRE